MAWTAVPIFTATFFTSGAQSVNSCMGIVLPCEQRDGKLPQQSFDFDSASIHFASCQKILPATLRQGQMGLSPGAVEPHKQTRRDGNDGACPHAGNHVVSLRSLSG